jgi:hypothetical protein
MRKIRTLSTIALVVLAPYLIFYPYEALDYQARMAFLEPGLWEAHRWVMPETKVAPSTKAVYFLIWLVPTAFGLGAILTALSIAQLFRTGIIFDDIVAKRILQLGRCTVASPFTAMLAGSVTPVLISWHNSDGPMALRFWYSAPNLSLVLCGLAFILMGAVLREGIIMARENEAFV